MSASATVKLSRKGRGSNPSPHGRPWQVLIDGSVVGQIAKGQTVELAVEPGGHRLRVRSKSYLCSPERSFEASGGRALGFSCESRALTHFLPQRWLLWLLVSLVKHDLWLALQPDETGEVGAQRVARPTSHRPTNGEVVVGGPLGSAVAEAGVSSLATVAPSTARPGTPAEAALRVEGLTKRFGNRTAFSEVAFEVAYGEVFGFLGPNGAGKTTTVRTLGTLITPTSGAATVAGIPLTPDNGVEIRSQIAIMPESPGLYLRLSVTENLQYFAGLYGLRAAGPRIEEALAAVNLSDRAGDLCGGLSKGLRQRVGLARTLLSDPKVMFLDEPTSGLDPVAALEVHNLIIGLRKRGVTIFLTTHRLEEAEKLCDRVAIMNTTLRTVGTPAELRAQLFKKELAVRTRKSLPDPGQLFAAVPGIEDWRAEGAGTYLLTVSDPELVAPEVTRGLVAAGADVVFLGEAQHSLEDVYLELIDEDIEARR
jgi:ABC-2 type transport system ATP-binding protein